MYNFVIDVLIWTFAIYGIISFIQEVGCEIICSIIKNFKFLKKYLKKIIDKKST